MIYYYRYLFVKMKVFNYSELHFSEVTFYKIPTLVENNSTSVQYAFEILKYISVFNVKNTKAILVSKKY